MIAALIAPLLALQSVGEAVVAVKNDNPETWSVEYPRLIQPFVADYRRCLAVTNRRVTGTANFEAQHAADLPRCADSRAKAVAASNADLDKQFNDRMAGAQVASETYQTTRPKGLVIELRDASVVKARTDASAAAAAAQDKDSQ
jgi:hypothetical protein